MNVCAYIYIYLSIYLFVYFIRRYIHACMHAQTHTYTQYIYTCIPCFHNSGVYIHGIYSPIAILLPYQVDQYKKICAYICLNKHIYIYVCVPQSPDVTKHIKLSVVNTSCTLHQNFAYTVMSSGQYSGASKALHENMLVGFCTCLKVTLLVAVSYISIP